MFVISQLMHRTPFCALKACLSGAAAFISMYVQKVPQKLFMALKILIYHDPFELPRRSFYPYQSSQVNL